MDSPESKTEYLVRLLIPVVNAIANLQPVLFRLIIGASPELSASERDDLLLKLKLVTTSAELLKRRSEEILPS